MIKTNLFQLMQQNPVTLGEKLRVHFRDVFNVLDIVGIATYLASFILKVILNIMILIYCVVFKHGHDDCCAFVLLLGNICLHLVGG